jgi:glycosyltransferase involved in cell wall biosynthesis
VKLIIQIPCHNEEETLAMTLADLPRSLPGITVVEWLVVDDGSTDGTAEVARAHGVDHVVRLPRHQGLARAFMAGLEASLKAGADIIVNTDADNQYCAEDIPKLIQPILDGKAELVIGARPIKDIEHFSFVKKQLEKLGSWAVRLASKANIPDAPSGFRAISRSAAMRLNVFHEYTYTLEMIIQAGQKGMAITSVPIRVNEDLRPSRLVKSVPSYVLHSVLTIIRIAITYRPFRFFAVQGAVSLMLGFLLGLRFLCYYFTGGGRGHVQSVILSALFISVGFFLLIAGVLADLIAVNRKMLEELKWRMWNLEISKKSESEKEPSDFSL